MCVPATTLQQTSLVAAAAGPRAGQAGTGGVGTDWQQATLAGVAPSGDVGESCCCLRVGCLRAAAWGWFDEVESTPHANLNLSVGPHRLTAASAKLSCTLDPML